MPKDYSDLLAMARRLVEEYGHEFVLVKYTSTPVDIAKPWDGPTDPRSPAAETANLFAVPIPPASDEALGIEIQGDLLKNVDQILIAEPGEDDPEDLDTYHEAIDGTARYAIQFVHKLKPADLTLLYFIGVRR